MDTCKFQIDFKGPLAIAEVLDDPHYKIQSITGTQDQLPGIQHIKGYRKAQKSPHKA